MRGRTDLNTDTMYYYDLTGLMRRECELREVTCYCDVNCNQSKIKVRADLSTVNSRVTQVHASSRDTRCKYKIEER